MVFHGRINRCDGKNMPDGKKLYTLRMSDCSKPFALRTNGEFVTYLGEERRQALPEGDEIFDSTITIVAREMSPGEGGSVKIKGDVYAGIVAIDKLTSTPPGALPQKPSK